MYAGTPPWDIGRPQPAFLGLAEAGALISPVLDVGCGTGEHVLMASALGPEATGVGTSPTAIAKAERKASERGLTATFHVQDALELGSLGEEFGTVLDCGLFHIFSDEDRPRYVESLSAVTRTGARYHMLCFSDRQPGDWGPRRVSRAEIRATFIRGWRVESIEPARIEMTISPDLRGRLRGGVRLCRPERGRARQPSRVRRFSAESEERETSGPAGGPHRSASPAQSVLRRHVDARRITPDDPDMGRHRR
jgi:SAM-dependent methyltransferase